jgi:regulator of RNase E activity RraA
LLIQQVSGAIWVALCAKKKLSSHSIQLFGPLKDNGTRERNHFMNVRKTVFLLVILVVLGSGPQLISQTISRDQMIFYTQEWSGDRFPDGRPKVSDDILARMKKISIEEAWSVLRGEGFHNQFEGGWKMIHQDRPIVGRAVTAWYVPSRPDLQERMLARGHEAGRIGPMNSWPIDTLTMGDVYVADAFGKIEWGTLIGDNLGNSIFTKTGNGVVFDGSLRDLEGLEELAGFNAFVRGWDPSYLQEMMLLGLNSPIRIGQALVLPGDVVLAKREGVIFIPAHLAEKVVLEAEIVMLRDRFGHQRLREGRYTPGQIDTRWSEEIEQDFFDWLERNKDSLEAPQSTVDELIRRRTIE